MISRVARMRASGGQSSCPRQAWAGHRAEQDVLHGAADGLPAAGDDGETAGRQWATVGQFLREGGERVWVLQREAEGGDARGNRVV